jgi:replicative DNA helicase
MQINLPTNPKLESLVLCAAINSNYALSEIIDQCEENDFFEMKNKIIFSCLKNLFHFGIYPSLQALLFEISKHDKKNEVQNNDVTSIAFEFWSGMPYEQYIKELKDLSLLRKIISLSRDMMENSSKEGADPEKILNEYQDNILKAQGISFESALSAAEISKNFNKDKTFKEDAYWRFEQHSQGKKTYEGISTGYKILDDTLGSFQNGYVYTIGARTSMGKTTFMLNLIKNALKHSRVGVFSLEMSKQIIYAKLACILSDVRYRDFYDGKISIENLKHIALVEEKLADMALFIDDDPALTTRRLESKAKRLKISKKIDILFIDYLTRIKCVGKYFSKHLEIDEISKMIQMLAKKLKIPIVVLAQLNRNSTLKKRPGIVDFKESGSIEEDSDACLLLHRPDYYDKDNKPGIMEIIVDKNRIMGTRKIIEFSCENSKSELYYELREINEMMKESQEESKVERMSYLRYCDEDDDE